MKALARGRTAAAYRPVFAGANNEVLDVPGLCAAVDGGCIRPAHDGDFIALPAGSLLLTLPGRFPIAFDHGTRLALDEVDGTTAHAVAAALPLGFTRTLLPAYQERPAAPTLPLYGFSAVAWSDAGLQVAAMRTDSLGTWSARSHAAERVRESVPPRLREFGSGPLIRQLARCALEYGCYTAQNVFLRQGEAAIPVSPACNADCVGCISLQRPEAGIDSAHERIKFLPSAEEIAAIATAHLNAVDDAIVSFGQGCEGEPLLAAPRIAEAIAQVRRRTQRGMIHCNTNASRPKALAQLIDAGLQSVRVSLNSTRPQTYAAYYRPQGYGFDDVCASLRLAAERGLSVSLNLLTHPGVTDDPAETEAFAGLLRSLGSVQVQTRTLNVDPARYFACVGRPQETPIGMHRWLAWLLHEVPNVTIGNFTRPAKT